MLLLPSFLTLVHSLAPAFTAPSLTTFELLLSGWVFARRRTVTAMVLAADAVGRKHHASFHRFFAAACWSLDALGQLVFALVEPFCEDGLALSIDDTLCRKRGTKRLFGAGMHHDPLASSKRMAVMSWGHCWVVCCVVVRLPFAPERRFSLPVAFRLYLGPKVAARWRLAARTRPKLAVELLHLVCGWRPARRYHAVADSAYGGESVLGHLPTNCDLTSRLVLNARLHAPPAPPTRARVGRPRKRGERLPTPEQMLRQRGERLALDLYGRKGERVRTVVAQGCAFKVPARLLTVVAVEPLTGRRPVQAFYSTVAGDTATAVLTRYAGRWSIEEANKASKTDLGMQQPQGWSRLAVRRTAPMAMLLYSLIVVWFARIGHRLYRPLDRPWYRAKNCLSFADMLRTLRVASLRAEVSAHLPPGRGRRNVQKLLETAAQMTA
jgi:DDE superfamily endonuclease